MKDGVEKGVEFLVQVPILDDPVVTHEWVRTRSKVPLVAPHGNITRTC